MPMPEAVTTSLASHGVLGAICCALLWLYMQKDRELSQERAARIADAQKYNELSLALQAKVLTAVDTLRDIFQAAKASAR